MMVDVAELRAHDVRGSLDAQGRLDVQGVGHGEQDTREAYRRIAGHPAIQPTTATPATSRPTSSGQAHRLRSSSPPQATTVATNTAAAATSFVHGAVDSIHR